MYNVIVVEDHPNILHLVCDFIQKLNIKGLNLVGASSQFEEGLQQICEKQPEIVIMDIELSNNNSFDLVEKIPDPKPKIIFISAHEAYALNSFEFSPIDFLKKPIDPQRLTVAIEKAIQQINLELEACKNKQVIVEGMVLLKGLQDIHLVQFDDIIRFEADKNYSLVFMANGNSIILKSNLSQVENAFSSFPLLKVHKSHIINGKRIASFGSKNNASYLKMVNGDVVPVSRKQKRVLLNWFSSLQRAMN